MTQLTLSSTHGDLLKRQGQSAIEDTDHSFIATMRDVAKDIASNSGFCTSDNLRVWADQYGLSPKDSHSWGCIFKGKGWVIVGYQKSAIPSNRSRPIAIWRWENGR